MTPEDIAKREAFKQRLRDQNETRSDWHATCRRCGARYTGTLAQLRRGHGCAAEPAAGAADG